jgi:hypothetical protein
MNRRFRIALAARQARRHQLEADRYIKLCTCAHAMCAKRMYAQLAAQQMEGAARCKAEIAETENACRQEAACEKCPPEEACSMHLAKAA